MKKVLVIGDVMIDRYIRVETSRNAQEAPVPVWDRTDEFCRLGGAANVALNVLRLGKGELEVYLAGIVPFDGEAYRSFEELVSPDIDCSFCVGGEPMVKTRFIRGTTDQLIARYDNKKSFSPRDISRFQDNFLDVCRCQSFDAVVVSDYDKGTVSPAVLPLHEPSLFRVVDSKRADIRMYEGFDVLKMNEVEFDRQVMNYPLYGHTFEKMFKHVVVTRGRKGAELRQYGGQDCRTQRGYVVHSEEFRGTPVKPVDVTGCGDTHTAAMVVSYLRDPDLRKAVRFANECAAQKVQMFGTGVPEEKREDEVRS